MFVFVLFYKKSIRSSSKKSSVLCFLLLFCPGLGPPSALPANCPGFLHPSGTAGGGCGMGTLTPAPRSRWLCVRVAPYCGAPRLTSLAAGTTPSRVVRVRIAVGICYQGPRCPTRHPPRGSWPAPCQLLFYCFSARRRSCLRLSAFSVSCFSRLSLSYCSIISCPGRGPPSAAPAIVQEPLRDHRKGVWHRDFHPGATTQMILCLCRILTVDATADVIGHRYHRCLW